MESLQLFSQCTRPLYQLLPGQLPPRDGQKSLPCSLPFDCSCLKFSGPCLLVCGLHICWETASEIRSLYRGAYGFYPLPFVSTQMLRDPSMNEYSVHTLRKLKKNLIGGECVIGLKGLLVIAVSLLICPMTLQSEKDPVRISSDSTPDK